MKALIDHPVVVIAIFAVLLSLPLEFGQMWLFAGASEMSHILGIQICMAATLGDAVIMVFAFGISVVVARSSGWVRASKTA